LKKRDGGEGIRVCVDDLDGLLGLIEMGVIEVHPWGATLDDIERPDVLVLDPIPVKASRGISWSRPPFGSATCWPRMGLIAGRN